MPDMQPWEVNAGNLRQRVTLEYEHESSTDSRGQKVGTWLSEIENIPAAVRPLSGRKLEIARQLVATSTHEIELHYRPEVKVHKRFRFGTRLFNIGHVNNVEERNRKLLVTCTEEIPEA